jgi:hypothetical protein
LQEANDMIVDGAKMFKMLPQRLRTFIALIVGLGGALIVGNR